MRKKKTLIITDGTEIIQSIAQPIKSALTAFEVIICTAEKFDGLDLLPAEIFFIGCEEPNPSSFSYLEKMLSHINLASRKCGIFSVNKETLKYLNNIIKDSEANTSEFLHTANGKIDNQIIEKWLNNFVR